jgi:hypothetical protein
MLSVGSGTDRKENIMSDFTNTQENAGKQSTGRQTLLLLALFGLIGLALAAMM